MIDPAGPLPEELVLLLPAALQAACERRLVLRGQCLFEAGGKPAWMHFVSQGEVVLQRMDEAGERVVLQRTRHGFVGEASLETDRYHCDAVVIADAQLTRLPLQALRAALQADADFALRWIGMLNRELRRLRLQCQRLSLNTVQARLLHLLRSEGGEAGLPLGAGLKALAPELGVTHEALYRCVAALERRGQLRRAEGRLRLLPAGQARPGSPAVCEMPLRCRSSPRR